MKKYLIIILSFSLCMFLLTLFLISNKNNNSSNNIEKGIDIYSTYDMNDLIILDDIYNDYSIVKVDNLKNNETEKLINNKILDCYKELIDNGYNDTLLYEFTGNFSNILSLNISGFNKLSNERKYYYLNFNLNDGSIIKFNDLFLSNTELLPIIHEAFLETTAKDNFLDENRSNPYRMSYASYVIDVHDRLAKFNEDAINNASYKFNNSDNKNFSIYADKLYIYDSYVSHDKDSNDSLRGLIKFINYTNDICIYDKYISNKSLYKNESNNLKHLAVCVDYFNNSHDILRACNELDNFYIDFTSDKVDTFSSHYDKDVFNKYIKTNEKMIKDVDEKIEDIKKIAKKDKKHMYVTFVSLDNTPYHIMANGDVIYSNAVSFKLNIKTYKFNKDDYDNTYCKDLYLAYESGINKLLDKKVKKYDSIGDKNIVTINNDVTYYSYNFITGKEIKTLDDMFINDSITLNDLEYELRYSLEEDGVKKDEIDNILKDGVTYIFTKDGILISSKTEPDIHIELNYNDIDISCFTIYDDDIKEKYKEVDDYEINVTSITK